MTETPRLHADPALGAKARSDPMDEPNPGNEDAQRQPDTDYA
jgi:hypothetical protein